MKYILGAVIILAIILVGGTIGANNDQLLQFNYLIAKSEIRLSSLVAILFGLGFIIGWLITGFFYLKLKLKCLAQQRTIKRQATQLDKMNEQQKAI